MGQGAEDMDTRWAWGGSRQAVEPPAQAGGATRRDRITAIRFERECGLHEATQIVDREDLIKDIEAATTVGDLKRILLRMV